MNLLQQLLQKSNEELKHSRPEDIKQTKYMGTEEYNKKQRDMRKQRMSKERDKLLETEYFTIFIESDKSLVSGHSDGSGYVGPDTEDTWIRVRDALNKHYELTTFTQSEMEILKECFTSNSDTLFAEDTLTTKPSSMTDREWKEFLKKIT